MSGARPEAQLVLAALSAATQLATKRHSQQHQRAMEELRQSSLAHMVDALATRRIDAVKEGFTKILAHYAEQAQHFMQQQQRYAERELESGDPFHRLELRSRINDLDVQLALVRAEARTIYGHMAELILTLGASSQGFAREFANPLALPPTDTGGRPWS